MRAVIVSIRGKKAAALGRDGVVYLVNGAGRSVGQVMHIGTAKKRWKKPLTWAACIAVLCAMATTGVYAAYEPYATVSVDGESTVEYTLNRFDQVLAVRAADEDSDELADTLEQELGRFAAVGTAVDRAVDHLGKKALHKKDGGLVVAVSAKEQRKAGELKENLGRQLGEERPDGSSIPPVTIRID